MSQIAAFYLIKNNQRHELPDGGCSGEVYTAIWDWCEYELDIDVRFCAPQTEDTLDCVLIDKPVAANLLKAFQQQEIPQLAAKIVADWDLPAEAAAQGLALLVSYLVHLREDTALLYEMV